jgi:hypothetical protein
MAEKKDGQMTLGLIEMPLHLRRAEMKGQGVKPGINWNNGLYRPLRVLIGMKKGGGQQGALCSAGRLNLQMRRVIYFRSTQIQVQLPLPLRFNCSA